MYTNKFDSAAFYEDSDCRNYTLDDDLIVLEIAVRKAKELNLHNLCNPKDIFPSAWQMVDFTLIKNYKREKPDNLEGLRMILLLMLFLHTPNWKSSFKRILVYLRESGDIWMNPLYFLCISFASVCSCDVSYFC